ncbi:MAG: hypothetical protein ACLPY1_05605 [Terracidiphilus sp.]
MEADWEFEVGGDAPVIDAVWPGFVDLRRTSPACDRAARVHSLPEAAQLPGLAAALEMLNAENSSVWTSKCDFWPVLQSEAFDPDELDAPTGSFAHAAGCYIDVLPKGHRQWTFPDTIASSCKNLCSSLHNVPLRCCRVDLIVRRALIEPDLMDTGITAYFTACGTAPTEAARTLEAALVAVAHALCAQSRLQWEGTGE